MQKSIPVFAVLVLLLTVSGCEPSDEERTADDESASLEAQAGRVAVTFLEHRLRGQNSAAYELASAEDRAATDRPQDSDPSIQDGLTRADPVTREVESVRISDDKKTARVTLIESISVLPTGGSSQSGERTMNLVREGGTWKVDTDWAENAERDAERVQRRETNAKMTSLIAQADKLIESGDFEAAKATLEEARELRPDDIGVQDRLDFLERGIKATVAGKWRKSQREGSPTEVSLRSSNALEHLGGHMERGKLQAECDDGEIGASFRFSPAKLRTKRAAPTVTVQIRLDDRAPTELELRATRRDYVPVIDPLPFLEALADADRLVVEATARNFADKQQWTYNLQGADDALAVVYDKCNHDK